jgi:hypothetical protein
MSTKKKNPLLAMSAGCVAGGIEATAVWPMEYIKVRSFSCNHGSASFSGILLFLSPLIHL